MRDLSSLLQRGIFPGVTESQECFLQRAERLPAQQTLSTSLGYSRIQELFCVCPDWVEVITERKGLMPWEGAATWIGEQEGLLTCQIQIKDSFLSRLYPIEEVLAHEMVHAMRLTFEEKRFEEVLAYSTSKSRFRRYFGPLFSSPLYVKVVFLFLLLPWLAHGVELMLDWGMGGGVDFAPLIPLAWGVYRLSRTQRTFKRALRNLSQAADSKGDANYALAIALCLSDREIEFCAQATPEQIRSYAAKRKEESCIRWMQLHAAYFA